MDIFELKPGDRNYMAYVGPPTEYDFMGATQFRLLCTLGLRANQSMLDVGCGSLRAGRLFIAYLEEGRYFGIEPNAWLIEDAIAHQLGRELISMKKPQFDHNSEFRTNVFSRQFDFIVAQSIFSHTGSGLTAAALGNFKESLKPDGLIVVTFIEGNDDFRGDGWVYPECVSFRRSTIRRFAHEAGLEITRIPWYHPRQTWYLLAKDGRRLPNRAMKRHLRGAVLFDPAFADSWKRGRKLVDAGKSYLARILPQPIKSRIKSLTVRGA